MIEFGNDTHGHTIARATNSVFTPNVETVISRSENGELYGGHIFSCYTGTSVCVDVAGFKPTWLNRDLIWVACFYMFGQLKCNVAIGRLSSANKLAIKLNTHYGFNEHSRIEGGVPGGDLIIMTMRKEECRWLDLKPKNLKIYDHRRKAA